MPWRFKLNCGNSLSHSAPATHFLLVIAHQSSEKYGGHEATLVWEFTTAFVLLICFSAWSFQKFPWMSAPIQVSLVGFWWVVRDGPPDKPPYVILLKSNHISYNGNMKPSNPNIFTFNVVKGSCWHFLVSSQSELASCEFRHLIFGLVIQITFRKNC